MPEQDLLSKAKEIVDAFNASDWEQIRDIAGNGVYHEMGTRRRLQGGDEIVTALQGWKEAMPDVNGTVTNGFTSGNQVALEVMWTGTQTAPLEPGGYIRTAIGTIPASGEHRTNPAAWIFEFDGPRIKESRQYFDMATFIPSAPAS